MPGLIVAIVAGLTLYFAAIPLSLGAHPLWAAKVVTIGAPLGIFGYMALIRANKLILMIVAALAIVAAYLIADIGKSRFGASYGDDATAGQMWYFGWITFCAFVPLLAAAAVQWLVSRRV